MSNQAALEDLRDQLAALTAARGRCVITDEEYEDGRQIILVKLEKQSQRQRPHLFQHKPRHKRHRFSFGHGATDQPSN
jgi:hypothetical protein